MRQRLGSGTAGRPLAQAVLVIVISLLVAGCGSGETDLLADAGHPVTDADAPPDGEKSPGQAKKAQRTVVEVAGDNEQPPCTCPDDEEVETVAAGGGDGDGTETIAVTTETGETETKESEPGQASSTSGSSEGSNTESTSGSSEGSSTESTSGSSTESTTGSSEGSSTPSGGGDKGIITVQGSSTTTAAGSGTTGSGPGATSAPGGQSGGGSGEVTTTTAPVRSTTKPTSAPTTTPIATPSGSSATKVLTSADQSSLSRGFTVPAGQVWEFAADRDVTLEVSGNVVVNGVLRMRPRSADIEHLLRFTGVDESRFRGGGMEVMASDVGLWVMGSGRLDIEGARRTGWTNLSGSASSGSRTIKLAGSPTGWRAGDEISIAPTASGDTSPGDFDVRKITAVSGSSVTLDRGLSNSYPSVNGTWTAEVMNLTRNVRIEGEGSHSPKPQRSGRAHIMIHSSEPQHIKYAQLRHMAPRRSTGDGDEPTDVVLGRYALHFHHSRDGSRGSIVEGVVARESGGHAFVPHASHGITMRDNVAYDGWADAYWWDLPGKDGADRRTDFAQDTNDLLYDHNIAAIVRSDPENRGFQITGFLMSMGQNMVIRDSVAVGIQGNVNASGFKWPERKNTHNSWKFINNTAHNNAQDGIFVWQNDQSRHVVEDFAAYHNGGYGVDQGAYRNVYQYDGLKLFSNGDGALAQHNAAGGPENVNRSDGYSLSFTDISSNGALVLLHQNLGSKTPALYRDCSFSKVVVDNNGSMNNAGYYDFVNCGLEAGDFDFKDVESGTTIRVQNGSQAFKLDHRGNKSTISPFYG